MYDDIKNLVIDNDPVHADFVRAICLVEEAIKFLKPHDSLRMFSNLLEIYVEQMNINAEYLNDSLLQNMKK